MAEDKRRVLDRRQIEAERLDLNDLPVLDSFDLSEGNYKSGLLKAVIFTLIAIFIFFVPLTVGGKTDIVFGVIYNFFADLCGDYGPWLVTAVILGTGVLSLLGKFVFKTGRLHDYFDGDSVVHPFLYLLGGLYALFYSLSARGMAMPEIIVGPDTGGSIIPSIVVDVFWIIIVGSFTMPFLLNYGVVDFIGSFMERLMRPIWKVPGRAAVNAIASFVSSSSVGVLITNKLYRMGVYTEKEAALVVTGFSAVSVGFAYMVIATAGLEDRFLSIYFSSLLLTLVVSAFIARIPPLSRKKDVFLNGHVQTSEERRVVRSDRSVVRLGLERAAKKAYTARPILKEMKGSLIDGLEVLPKVISLLSCVGVTAMIIAENTPVFQWLGKIFEPILRLCQVPNAAEIAPSFPVGIAEMFLPVLLIKNQVATLAPGARYVVVAVSIVQILFFSETIVVITASKMPVSVKELVMVFIERTIIAIPFAALFMHLMF